MTVPKSSPTSVAVEGSNGRIAALIFRARPLLKLAGEFTVAYVATRFLAALSSIALVRLLSLDEYGIYTLLLTAFTFVCTSSDLGSTETLSYFRRHASRSGKSWQRYFQAVMRFRRVIFALVASLAAVYVYSTARHLGLAAQAILPGIVVAGLGAWFAVHASVLSFVLKLEQRFRSAYFVDFGNETTKLVSVGAIWLLGMTTALAGISGVALGAGASLLLVLAFHRRGDSPAISTRGLPARSARASDRALRGQILPTLPGAIHFTLQGVFIAWLAAYFGSSTNLAQVGALGRLGVLIALIAGFTGTVLIPRMTAIQSNASFLKRYLQVWMMQLASGGGLLLLVLAAPGPLLRLLGSAYSGLHAELVVAAATAVVSTWGGFVYSINRIRGWVKYQPWAVPVIVAGQIVLFFALDLSSTQGVLEFGLGSFTVGMLYQLLLNILGFRADAR